jgi:DNA ligase (NAD+)
MDIQSTIQSLREELNQHNYNYYVLDNLQSQIMILIQN